MRQRSRYGVMCLLALVVAAGSGHFARPALSQAQTRPNIILIQADDLGYGDLSAYGQAKFQTPGIDRLAREGIRFTSYYSGSTVCAPSRAALMTGHAHRARVDPRQRRDPAAARGRDGGDAAARRRLPHGASSASGGSAIGGHDRAAGQEGLRLLVRLPRPSPRAPAVHRSPVPQRRARAGRSQPRLRQRPLHPRGRGVHHPRRSEAVLHLPELHRAARRAAGAGRLDGAVQGPLPAGDAVRQRGRRWPAGRRDARRRLARLPLAADAARGLRGHDHADGSRHRPA